MARRGTEGPRRAAGSRALAWGVFVAVWVAFIWGHSLMQGPQSSAESDFFYNLAKPLFDAVGLVDAELATFIIRKCAHFTEYAVLGAGAANLAKSLVREGRAAPSHAVPAAAALALVAVLDESIQLHVPGRQGAPRDVLIDLAGFACGALLAYLAIRRRQKA